MTQNNQPRSDKASVAVTANQVDVEQVAFDELEFNDLETDAEFDRLEKLLSTVRIPTELTHRWEDQTDRCLTLPGFRHLAFLGRGGFGRVYLAEDERLGRRVAIKVPRSRPFDGDDQLERTMREARVVATLKHPGIVPLYEAILHDGECCLVCEYVEGGTLEQRLASGPIETARAIEIARQIAEALAHAHQQNIVHRDLKPQNILIDADGRPRITDFGLAIRHDQQAAELGATAGTLEYLAPEQLPGSARSIDSRTDLWAFGVVLYRMLTGRLPFGANRGPELLDEIAQRAPKPPRQLVPDVPAKLERICLRCLEKSPQDRFSSAAEIVAELRHIDPAAAANPFKFKSRFAVAGAAVFAVTVLGGIATLAWRTAHRSNPVGAASLAPRAEVKSMRILRHAYSDDRTGVAMGAIGVTTDHAQFDDDIRLDIQFSEPAYSYVLEFSCNGRLLLHDPAEPQQAPTARSELTIPSPPSSSQALNYLALVDGTGLNVFCVIASREPLPPFAEWQRQVGTIPWGRCQAEGVWRFTHEGMGTGHFVRERSSPRQRAAPPAPLTTLCDYLREHAPGATIEAIAFPVLPKERGAMRPRAAVGRLPPALTQQLNSLNRRIQQHFGQGEFAAAVPVAELAWQRCLDVVGAEARATQEAAALLATSRQAAGLAAEPQQELAAALRRLVQLRSPPHAAVPVGPVEPAPLAVEPPQRDANHAEDYRDVVATMARYLGEDDAMVIATRLKWAWYEYAQGNWSHALSVAEGASAAMSQRFDARYVGIASCAELIGLIQLQQQRDGAARTALEQALDLYTEEFGPKHPTVRRCRAQLAFLLTRSGQYTQAGVILRSVLDEAHRADEDPRELIRILLLLSHQLTESGEWVRAEATLREALSLVRDDTRAGREQVAALLAQLSSCLRSLGRDAEAEQAATESYRRIVDLYGSQHPQTARGAWNLAHARYAAGNYAAALTSVVEVLQLQQRFDSEHDQPLTRQARQLKIDCERQLGRPTATDDYEQILRQRLQQAREQNSNGTKMSRLALACGELAIFLSESNSSKEAEPLLDEAIRLSQQSLGADHEQTIVLQQRRGEQQFLSGNLPQAIAVLQQAADAAARTRVSRGRSGLTGLSRGSFNRRLPLLAIALATQGEASEAWQRLEEGKSRGLWDDLQQRTTADHQVSASDPGSRLAWTGEPFSLARVQRQISPVTALVTWTGVVWRQHDRGEYWACVLRAQGEPRWIRLAGSGQQQTLSNEERSLSGQCLATVIQAPTQRDRVWDPSDVRSLYDQRFAPLVPALEATDALPRVSRLVVIYPGPTHLPLEVLTDEFTISYAPSATIYAWLKEQSAKASQDGPGQLLAVGATVFRREDEPAPAVEMSRILPARDLPPLPGARREVESLGKLFGAQATTIMGESATTVQLAELARSGRLRDFSYLHFATHGEANQRVPLQSALIFGHGSAPRFSQTQTRLGVATDGRLTAEQILNDWQLKASLVTLSACETALGPAVEGEHLLGFSHAFLLAGSRSVVASMWAVRDDATSLLMHRFYQNLLGQRTELPRPLPKAEALREAKQWIRELTAANLDQEVRDAPAELRSRIRRRIAAATTPAARPFSDPYFWAPFILIGDDE